MSNQPQSDTSVGGPESSAVSLGSPRVSLDEVLAQRREEQQDFSDMPSLSSFRADDMSAFSRSSYNSSNSRAGDSRGGDCDASLPSLSSFRMEDLSTCSSFHSIQTNTNNFSDQSADGWASVTSGNVSADTDSEDSVFSSQRKNEDGLVNATKPKRSNSATSDLGSPTSANNVDMTPVGDGAIDGGAMKQPTRTASPAPGGPLPTASTEDRRKSDTTTGKENARGPDGRKLERAESLPIGILRTPRQEVLISSSSILDHVQKDGSSSSLRGGDSLPRIPRRSTADVDAGSQDDDDSQSSDELSAGSDVQSDISIDTDDENDSVDRTRVAASRTEAPVLPRRQETKQDDEFGESFSLETSGQTDEKEKQVEETVTQGGDKSTSNVKVEKPPIPRSEEKVAVHKTSDESLMTSAEESGTSATSTIDMDNDDAAVTSTKDANESKDNDTNKRGKLLKKVSTSFRSIGRSASLRNSFRMIGRTASKIKNMGSRKPSEEKKGSRLKSKSKAKAES